MINEIKILVRTQNSSKAGLQEVETELQKFATDSSEKFSKKFSENLTKNMTTTFTEKLKVVSEQAQQSARQAGDRLGNTIGERVSVKINERITRDVNGRLRDELGRFVSGGGNGHESVTVHDRNTDHVKVDVNVDKQSLMQKLASFGKAAGEKFGNMFGEGFQTSVTSIFSGDIISTIIKAIAVAFSAAVLGPILGAGVTAAFGLALGGGAIGLGIAGAFKDPRIQRAAKDTLGMVGKLFNDFSANFKGPLEDFFAPANGGGGGLVGIIKQITPMVQHLGQVLGPVAGQLGQGIIGMLQNMLPGVLRAIEKSAPIIEKLADKLPGLGESLGKFFDHMGNGAPAAAKFLGDLIELIKFIIRFLGNMIEKLTSVYGTIHDVVSGAISLFKDLYNAGKRTFFGLISTAGDFLDAAAAAFGWIPGIGPKLKTAQNAFRSFKDAANKSLSQINKNINVTVRIKTIGLDALNAAFDIGRQLKALGYIGKAAGGVVGHAAEGGVPSGMTWVGEHGPELLNLPVGSSVRTAGDSQRMAGQGGSGHITGTLRLKADRTTERGLIDVLFGMLRTEINASFGGDVQAALGG